MKLLFKVFHIIAVAMLPLHAQAAISLTNLYSFNGTNGADPESGLVSGLDGNLYGTTTEGGPTGHGNIYRISPEGFFTNFYSFNGTNGSGPRSSLLLGGNGLLYGTTYSGSTNNAGMIFQVDSNSLLKPLYAFSSDTGGFPVGGLIQSQSGDIYGTTALGGTNAGGTVFKFTANGLFDALVSFNISGFGGNTPYSSLLLGSNGYFYGTTDQGGTNDYGTIYRVDTNGVLTTLVSFSYTNGAYPYGNLVYGPDGAMYGTTYGGGANGYGTVFKLDSLGTLTTLVSFNNTNGASPQAGLLLGQDGKLYGSTSAGGDLTGSPSGHGTIFELTTNGNHKLLAAFNGTNGNSPEGALIQDAQGNFYGTTAGGGYYGFGTVFRLSVALQTPQFLSIVANGQTITMTWTATVQNTYQFLYKTNLNDYFWSNLNGPFTATNAVMTTIDPTGSNSQRFYEILMLP